MFKFNYELKLNIVLEYLNGSGSTTLAHKYGVAKAGTILNWVNMYKAYGLKGLIVRNTNIVYSGEYKLKVLNWMHTYHKSYPETALHFNISAPSTIFTWQRRMETKGLSGLYTKRGCHKMPNIKNIKSNNQAKIDYQYLIKYEYMRMQYNHKNDSTFNQIYMLIHKLSNLPKSYILKVIGFPEVSTIIKLRKRSFRIKITRLNV